jgi:hypothetical protein
MITEFEGFKVGDMVTCYWLGYYNIIGFEYHKGILPLQVVVQRIADSNGNKCSGKPRTCIAHSIKCGFKSIDARIWEFKVITTKLDEFRQSCKLT